MTRWLETDTYSNKDISTAVSVGVYTADADRMILVQALADQVAGNGDYEFYVTLQVNGSGSSYRLIPVTTAAAASGLTAIAAQSGMIAVRSGDVLTVYLDGLAGDNSTPDTAVRWYEMAALQPATPGRTLVVDASGNVVLAAAQGAVTFGQVKVVADVAGEGAFHVVNSNADGYGTVSQGDTGTWNRGVGSTGLYNTGANTGVINGAPTGIGQQNLGVSPVIGVDTAGILAALGMAYSNLDTQLAAITAAIQAVTDVIDMSGVTVTTSNNAGLLTVYRGVTFAATVSGLAISASWTKVYLTIKTDLDTDDTASIIQVVETNPGAGTDGLLYLNGAAPVNPITYADAALVVTQAAGTVAIALSDNMTAQLARARSLHWDIKQIINGTTSALLASGTANVELTPTRTI